MATYILWDRHETSQFKASIFADVPEKTRFVRSGFL